MPRLLPPRQATVVDIGRMSSLPGPVAWDCQVTPPSSDVARSTPAWPAPSGRQTAHRPPSGGADRFAAGEPGWVVPAHGSPNGAQCAPRSAAMYPCPLPLVRPASPELRAVASPNRHMTVSLTTIRLPGPPANGPEDRAGPSASSGPTVVHTIPRSVLRTRLYSTTGGAAAEQSATQRCTTA